MALQGFQIQPPSTVILDDDRDPDVSWANHESRYPGQSNRGGVDVVAAVGTPVYAWADGTVLRQPNNGSAGNVARLALAHDPGWLLDYKHLSGYAVAHGTWVARGDLIGYSGNSGGVTQHLHLNLVDPGGVRRNPWHYTDSGSASAGRPAEPIPLEDDMAAFTYPKDRTDSVAYLIDLNDPKKPLAKATGAEFQIGVAQGAKVIPLEAADFQALLRSRGLFVQDAGLRIAQYSDAAVRGLSAVNRQYAINFDGFLAVRAAG